ncbi:MAG: COG4705 family protein [Solirubrobacteraceae bacterium]
MKAASGRREPAIKPGSGGLRADGQLPFVGRLFPAPIAVKVPEIIFLFWVVKILTTAGGEVTSDYLKHYGNFGGGGTEVALFVIALVLQFATRRYRVFAYWSLAYAIAIAGTGLADFMHLDVHIPYAGTTLLWAAILAGVFVVWYRSEGTLSIHSITTQRREAFYWATVFATFALGTALGDYTAASLNLGYLDSGILFFGLILIPALAWWRLRVHSVLAFWAAYVITRPLGASFSDWISKPRDITGLNFGNGQTAVVIAVIVFLLVSYLAIARPDVQGAVSVRPPASGPTDHLEPALESDLE